MEDPYKNVRRDIPKPGFKYGFDKYKREKTKLQRQIAEDIEEFFEEYRRQSNEH